MRKENFELWQKGRLKGKLNGTFNCLGCMLLAKENYKLTKEKFINKLREEDN